MPLTRLLVAASAAALLGAGVAAAQTPQPAEHPDPGMAAPPAAADLNAPAEQAAPPADTATPPSGMAPPAASAATSSGTDVAANAAVESTTVASPPVPDTPENRQKYGGPMSRAGRHTSPAGN